MVQIAYPQTYQYNIPGAPPQQERPPSAWDQFSSSFGAGLGEGLSSGVNRAITGHIRKSMLDKAFREINPESSIDQQLQAYGKLDPETQQALTPLLNYRIAQEKAMQKQKQAPAPTLRQEVDRERLYNQLTKQYNDQPEKKEEFLKFGNMFMGQGSTPFQAYSKSKDLIQKREKAFGILDKMPEAGDSFLGFGKNKTEREKQVKARIQNARKSGVLTDDDLTLKLLEKGWGPEEIDKFGLEPSNDFMSALAEELSQEQDNLNDLQAANTQVAPRSQQPTQPVPARNQNQARQAPAEMPDPVANAGKQIRDKQTGQTFRSDGKTWVPQ